MRVLEMFGRRTESDSVDRAVEAFEAKAGPGGPSLGRYWAKLGSGRSPSILAALVKVDLRRRFESGERPRVLEYLREFPVLAEVDDRVVSLVYEEYCLLEENGERPDSLAFCEEYGPWRDSLRSQLAYHRELSRAVGAESPTVNFPDLGDRFAQYRLTSLLGVGGVARVYLATEDDLGGRQVAIKVSASFGQEPSILAKLDHRNIVPILTVAESESGLRGICMPYRPGATLEDLIKRIGRGAPPRHARAISDALHPRDSPQGSPPEEQRAGWSDFPVDRTFAEAVAWIGLALAHALSYLHRQGIFHRDIKPANILLAYREGPQLLDFNLAQVPSSPEGASAAQKGGTLPYMAPEQLKAFLDPTAWEDVRSAADLYSLGLVLRELLTGRPPELPISQGSLAREIQSLIDRRLAPRESISEINPGVPPALESIVGKCLAFEPGGRYASANELADDLRRFLDRKPLRVAPNTSKFELAVNWICRNRQAVASTLFFLLVVASLSWSLSHRKPGEWQFREAKRHLDSGTLEGLELAAREFKVLRGERPDTAMSALGLALALHRLGDPGKKGDINDLFKEAASKPDAEKAIRTCLEKEPGSYLLHLNLGLVLEMRHQYELARLSLGRALEINPDGYSAHVLMARCDDMTQRYSDAFDHLEKAIELGRRDVEVETIYNLRKAVLHMLVNLLDRRLESGKGPEPGPYCRRLESHMRRLEAEWKEIAVADGQNLHSYTVAFYEGSLFSIRGVLEADEATPNRSLELFDEAGRRFQDAGTLAPRLKPRDRHLPITAQLERLGRRREMIARSASAPAIRPVSGPHPERLRVANPRST